CGLAGSGGREKPSEKRAATLRFRELTRIRRRNGGRIRGGRSKRAIPHGVASRPFPGAPGILDGGLRFFALVLFALLPVLLRPSEDLLRLPQSGEHRGGNRLGPSFIVATHVRPRPHA